MDFNEISGAAEGWLEIIKVTNGEEEIVFSDKNVVCSGMGVTLASMFSATGVDVSSYQINLFQLGSSGTSALQVSSTGRLGDALNSAELGTNSLMSLDKKSGTIVSGTATHTSEAFLALPVGYVDRIDKRTARWNLHIDEATANGHEINEIGMFLTILVMSVVFQVVLLLWAITPQVFFNTIVVVSITGNKIIYLL